MLDDFRRQAEENASFEEEKKVETPSAPKVSRAAGLLGALKSERRLLGLNAMQRFIVSVLLLVVVILASIAGLMLLGKMAPPVF